MSMARSCRKGFSWKILFITVVTMAAAVVGSWVGWSQPHPEQSWIARGTASYLCALMCVAAVLILLFGLDWAYQASREWCKRRRFDQRMETAFREFFVKTTPHPLSKQAVDLHDRCQRLWRSGFEGPSHQRDQEGLMYCWAALIEAQSALDSREPWEIAEGEAMIGALELMIRDLERRNGYRYTLLGE